jgi:hypothetical protein
MQLFGFFNRFQTVACLATYSPTGARRQQSSDAPPHYFMVVDDKYAQRTHVLYAKMNGTNLVGSPLPNYS